MKKYLLDTNICAFFLRGKFDLNAKVQQVGEQSCFISEITIAELKYGIENASTEEHRKQNKEKVDNFLATANILSILPTLDIYAKEKTRLRKLGTIIDEFDLLIGATALANDLIMVTNNVSHLGRLDGIVIEDWTKS
ncbi:MAG: type II toxin-antitoxin system VapC family toxin [Bacteroidetes bacterium]|nr:type II toxin-antitoxin system VapC family toxin [Bacteroidota bacterium]